MIHLYFTLIFVKFNNIKKYILSNEEFKKNCYNNFSKYFGLPDLFTLFKILDIKKQCNISNGKE